MPLYASYAQETASTSSRLASRKKAAPTQWCISPSGTLMIPSSLPGRAAKTPSRATGCALARTRARKLAVAILR